MITNDKVLNVVSNLNMYEMDLLLGKYQPTGAAAAAIYDYLVEDVHVLDWQGNPTEFGKEVINYLKEYYEQV